MLKKIVVTSLIASSVACANIYISGGGGMANLSSNNDLSAQAITYKTASSKELGFGRVGLGYLGNFTGSIMWGVEASYDFIKSAVTAKKHIVVRDYSVEQEINNGAVFNFVFAVKNKQIVPMIMVGVAGYDWQFTYMPALKKNEVENRRLYGLNIGFGVDYRLNDWWSLGLSAEKVFFNEHTVNFSSPFAYRHQSKLNLARCMVTIKFAPWRW